jgi:tRNA1Val (adenine37-N6)-methyltransferase
MIPSPLPDETLDSFFDRTLHILQKKKGYRFSVDAVLLSRFVTIRKDERVVDLGTGCGILPLFLSLTTRARSFTGIEVQKDLAEIAGKNVLLNRLSDRVTILCEDFRQLRQVYPSGAFEVVISNPPYRKSRSGRLNPSAEKAVARHEIMGTLHDLVSTAAYLLPAKGRFYLIYPASRAVDLVVELRAASLEPKRIQYVHPRAGEEARFILVESLKSTGIEVKVMPPLILDGPP